MEQKKAQAVCRSCGAEILWAKVKKRDGNMGNMPFDPEPTDAGTHQLFKRPDGTVYAAWIGKGKGEENAKLRTSHFATCPNADKHRQR